MTSPTETFKVTLVDQAGNTYSGSLTLAQTATAPSQPTTTPVPVTTTPAPPPPTTTPVPPPVTTAPPPPVTTAPPPPVTAPPAPVSGALNVNEQKVIAAANKIGINLGGADYWDSGQILKNRLNGMRSPGFEGSFKRQLQQIASATTTTITSRAGYDSAPLNYWAGGKLTIKSGPLKETSVTITGNTKGGSGGVTYTISPALASAPTEWTSFIVENASQATQDFTDWYQANGGTFAANTTDLPPGTPGVQALHIDASASSSYPTVDWYWDSEGSKVFYLNAGTYTLAFWAKAHSGTPTVNVSFGRYGGFTCPSQTVTLTPAWAKYTLHFAPNEQAATVKTGTVYFSMTLEGGIASLDDCSFIADADTNPTVFTSAFLAFLNMGRFDAMRHWTGQSSETLDNWLLLEGGRKLTGQGIGASNYVAGAVSIGIHEFLAAAQYAGLARVSIVMPITFNPIEGANFVQYLAGASSTTYGAKRAALGQTAPWTTVFTEINVEYGNEVWNTAQGGGSLQYSPAGDWNSYYDMVGTMFTAMRASASWSSVLKLVVTEQMSSYFISILPAATLALVDKFDLAPYTQSAPTAASSTAAIFTPVFVEGWANVNDANSQSGFAQALAEILKLGKQAHVYEFQNSLDSGSFTQANATGFAEGAAYGVANILQALEGMKHGAAEWNFFALPQFNEGFTNSEGQSVTTKIWGAVIDIGGATNRVRPNFLGLQAANSAILPEMLSSTLTSPTFAFAASNQVNAQAAVPYLTGYAFMYGKQRGVILINSSLTTAETVSGITGMTAPAGAITALTLTSPNPTDNNEDAQTVALASSTLASLSAPITVPPFSMIALSWATA
jgi:hypothetical protein